MARPLRLEYTGALYHVTSRGDRQEDIFEDDEDRQQFLQILNDVSEACNWVCHAYCLMTNHYHLLIETPDANLSKGMRQLNGVYTQTFNRAHDLTGHLFQGRYKAIIVEKQSYLLELARYIVLNPVRAQMVRSTRDWRWSSYRSTIGQAEGPACLRTDFILSAFGKRRQKAIEGYKQFVVEGKRQLSPWHELTNQVYLGSDAFITKIQNHIDQNAELDEVPSAQRRPVPRSLKGYQRKYKNRNTAIYEAYRSGGYTLKDIGQYFDLHYSTVSGIIKDHKAKT